MTNQRIYGAVGLAKKAGKCICGDYAVEKALKSGKVSFILMDESASDATKYRYMQLCERKNASCVVLQGLGPAIGRAGNKIVAITDDNFINMIKSAL